MAVNDAEAVSFKFGVGDTPTYSTIKALSIDPPEASRSDVANHSLTDGVKTGRANRKIEYSDMTVRYYFDSADEDHVKIRDSFVARDPIVKCQIQDTAATAEVTTVVGYVKSFKLEQIEDDSNILAIAVFRVNDVTYAPAA